MPLELGKDLVDLGCEIFWGVFSSRALIKKEKCISFAQLLFSVCIFFEGGVFTFQFLKDKTRNYVLFDIIVNFVIKKVKSKHTSLRKYTN
jgi:hypothetical protein